MKYCFSALLQRDGWHRNVVVHTNDAGIITKIDDDLSGAEMIKGYALPGFQNAHSHAFQYAMVGLAEHQTGTKTDDFWSWREKMYQLALTLNPEEMTAVAAMLYSELLRNGYTDVAEFHYLHHDKEGQPYQSKAAMGEALMQAAEIAGINLTLVPMFYQKGGFGVEPQIRQRRFISPDIDDYLDLIDISNSVKNNYQYVTMGHGIHSLRAVSPQDIQLIIANKNLPGPFHLHIAEQLKEIADAVNFLGTRPVSWLLDHNDIHSNHHLVHATHLSDSEVQGIAHTGAHVVICPSTEGNLGDGLFRLLDFQSAGGKWSIGTDSHIGLNPCEELRILDYAQRLSTHRRNIFYSDEIKDSATYALSQCIINGRKAMGNQSTTYFSVGEVLNAVVYAADQPLLETASAQYLTSTIIYHSDISWVDMTICRGKIMVKNGHHCNEELIKKNFIDAIKKLKIR